MRCALRGSGASCFLLAKRRCPNTIHAEMCPVYGVKCFTRPAIRVWCNKFAYGRECVVDEKRPGRCVVSTTDPAIASVASLIRSDRRVSIIVQINLDNMLKNNRLMFDILNRFHCWTHSFLPRCMECSCGIAMGILSVCPSVCPSVKRVHCDKTEEKSVQIFIPCERSFCLVLWDEEWLVGGDPFYLKFWVNRPALERNRRFWTDNRS